MDRFILTALFAAVSSHLVGCHDGAGGTATAAMHAGESSGSTTSDAATGPPDEPSTGMVSTGTEDATSGASAAGTGTGTPGGSTTGAPGSEDDGGDAGGSTTDDRVPCDESQFGVKPIAPNVVLVLDKSGSMVAFPAGVWDGDGDPDTPAVTRWSSLHRALAAVIGKYSVNLGTKLFPAQAAKNSGDGQACLVDAGVEVPVNPTNKDAILAGIPAQDDVSLAGATPMATALASALDHLGGLDPAAPRALVLVTNGAANCATEAVGPELFEVYDEQVHAIVADAWTANGIPSHVVGIAVADVMSPNAEDGVPDGINLVDKLDALAIEGGRPAPGVEKFHNVTTEVELIEALSLVLFDTLSCVLPLTDEPAFPDDTDVVVAGAKLPRITDCTSEDGWRYSNAPPYTAIEVCGKPCYDLKFAGYADISYYCSAG